MQGITVKNVAMVYAAAIKFQAETLEKISLRFISNHMPVVTKIEAF